MMKLVFACLAVAMVMAVPITQVQKEVPVAAAPAEEPVKAVPATEASTTETTENKEVANTEEAAATVAKTEEVTATTEEAAKTEEVTATPEEAAKTEDVTATPEEAAKTEEVTATTEEAAKTEVATTEEAAKTEETAPAAETEVAETTETTTATEEAATEGKAVVKQEALSEIVNLVSVMAGAKQPDAEPLPINQIMSLVATLANGGQNNEDALPIGDLMQAGMGLLAQAQQIQTQIEQSGILNEDPAKLLGVKEDGSFDLNEAADRISGLMTMFGVPPLSTKEKNVMHEIVTSFQSALQDGHFETDMAKIVEQVNSKVDEVTSKVGAHDSLLNPETLLEVVDEPTRGIDTQLITDVAGRFMATMEKQFDFATQKLNTL